MRSDRRLIDMTKLNKLPCKSTINNYAFQFSLKLLSEFNRNLIDSWIKKPVDLLLDSSGIRLVGRSIWFCIKIKRNIRKKDCDKIHLAVSLCSLLIANFKISNSRRNDSPFLKKLLKPFSGILGLVLADKGYSGKKNAEYVLGKKGSFFCPFKSNADPDEFSLWNKLYKLWRVFPSLCENIYHQRSKIEAVFSALKRKYGDQLYSKKWFMRRREMAMRFIAYNIRIIVGIQIAREKNIPLWVRA
ncbi:transposase [Candidatus Woesearchaeota archaeon]|nr:transposase [Candidatus Woesearchaeota archaeon]